MLRSMYLTGTNMLVNRRKMDVITNNIANVETTGFKKDGLVSRSFADLLISRLNDPNIVQQYPEVGPLNTGIHVDEVVTDFVGGAPQETEEFTDFALVGDGFFVVATPQGERYTRDGSFTLDHNGYLVTANGYYVMGTNGLIQVNREDFVVTEDGQIQTSQGFDPGSFRLVRFDDLAGLRKEGNNLFTNFTGQAVLPSDSRVWQGYVEASNVEAASEMVDMISAYRSYENSQRILRILDESLAKAVNEVGKV